MNQYKAKILWHDMWFKGPLIGVAEYNGEKVVYFKAGDNKFELRRFIEGGYDKALQHHVSYRNQYGGTRDHDPSLHFPYKHTSNQVTVFKTFNYKEHSIDEVIAVLQKEDFEWYTPNRSYTSSSFIKTDKFNPEATPGYDIDED